MKKVQIYLMLIAFMAIWVGSCDKKRKDLAVSDNTTAVMETSMGTIELEFFPQKAPKHVENFIQLSKDGFYKGTTFHRVIPGFMIQGGCPNSKLEDRSKHGQGGPGYSIAAEFNDIKHVRGILSMARSADPDSAGSQFFIVTQDSPHLDGLYSAFGKVIEGMDVVDKIVSVETSSSENSQDNPLERIEIKQITIQSAKN